LGPTCHQIREGSGNNKGAGGGRKRYIFNNKKVGREQKETEEGEKEISTKRKGKKVYKKRFGVCATQQSVSSKKKKHWGKGGKQRKG